MALVGCWPSVHPEAWVVLPRSVQLGREGGHLGPPAWCPHVGNPAGEPWESQLPGTLNPFDCGSLRVPAVLAAPPMAQGDLSNTARPPGPKDKARGSTTHTNVHTRPHTSAQTTPTSTLGHTLPGHLHRPLAGTQIPMQSIGATRLCAQVHRQTGICPRAPMHMRTRAVHSPIPAPCTPPASIWAALGSWKHREAIDPHAPALGGMRGLAGVEAPGGPATLSPGSSFGGLCATPGAP